MKLLILPLFISLATFLTAQETTGGFSSVKVAFFGDGGIKDRSRTVLKLIKDEKADILVHLGDFDYKNDPEAWDAMITKILGKDFPVLAALGNHDIIKWKEYQKKLEERLALMKDAKCEGPTVIQTACSFRGIYLALITPSINTLDHVAFLQNALPKATSPWRICAWHIPHKSMQTEPQNYNAKLELYEECRKAGAIIATGHSHTYSRTHLMENFTDPKIASDKEPLEITAGKTFAFVSGLGGESIRPRKKTLGPWFAKAYGSQDGIDYGALFCSFEAKKASCYFKDISGHELDRFEITNSVQ